MAAGVLVDTSFLITLADPERANHGTAVAYWKFFRENQIPIYLSAIVVSEFEVRQSIDEAVRRACFPLVFDFDAAALAARFDREREREPGITRQAVKDDLKIIAQAVAKAVAFVISDDHDTFAKYVGRLQEQSEGVEFTMLLLRDGFDAGNFRAGGKDLVSGQGV